MTETLKSMKQGLKYIVVTGTDCGTFQTGDRVSKWPNYFVPDQMDVMCRPREGGGPGWLEQWEWLEFADVRVSVDAEYNKELVAWMKKEIARLEGS